MEKNRNKEKSEKVKRKKWTKDRKIKEGEMKNEEKSEGRKERVKERNPDRSENDKITSML